MNTFPAGLLYILTCIVQASRIETSLLGQGIADQFLDAT
jgi:hypothetical protein